MRCPTVKQYGTLRMLAGGAAGLSFTAGTARPLLRHGWVTADLRPPYYQFVRITPDGLRALAEAVERYGLPDLGPRPVSERKVCGDCGRDWRPKCKCGSSQYRYEQREVEVA